MLLHVCYPEGLDRGVHMATHHALQNQNKLAVKYTGTSDKARSSNTSIVYYIYLDVYSCVSFITLLLYQ